MNNFDTINLKNGIKVIYKKNQNTPRLSLNLFINSGIKCEEKPGTSNVTARLLLQGTKKRNAVQIAEDADSKGIELGVESKQDYLKLKSVFLNEDLEDALEICSDVIKNSTFEDLEKEKIKFKGEIDADMDSPKTKAADNFIINIYPNHPYGHGYGRILKSMESINQQEIKNLYYSNLSPDNMIIVVVGDIEKQILTELLEKYFGDIAYQTSLKPNLALPELNESKTVTIAKSDAAQAQVIQGWIVPGILSEDFAPLNVLNTILGSGGLSSRLFVELRDKQGLAYVVRSTFEPLKYCGTFTVYIATAPKNIKICLDGFKAEIGKLQDITVNEKELEDAKNNILGKRAFFHETNAQQAYFLGHYDILGLGAEFDDEYSEKIKNVKASDIQNVAKKYLSGNSIISLLAPEEYLNV